MYAWKNGSRKLAPLAYDETPRRLAVAAPLLQRYTDG
jgi:hypothetical protein